MGVQIEAGDCGELLRWSDKVLVKARQGSPDPQCGDNRHQQRGQRKTESRGAFHDRISKGANSGENEEANRHRRPAGFNLICRGEFLYDLSDKMIVGPVHADKGQSQASAKNQGQR